MSLIELIGRVPGAIWSVLLGSFLTLFGVLLSHRHQTKQQRTRLEHEAAENAADRKHAMRREVYLAAASEIAAAQQQLLNLANIDLTAEPTEMLDASFSEIAKVSLVASDESIVAFNDYAGVYTRSYFRLLSKLSPIQDARTERDLQDGSYRKYQGEVDRILATMTQVRESAKLDDAVWTVLEDNFEFNQERAVRAADARSDAWDRLLSLQGEFMKAALAESKKVSEAAVPAFISIRRELDLDTDNEGYSRAVEAQYAMASELIDDVLQELEADEAESDGKE